MTERAIGVTDVASGAGVADYRMRERTVGGSTVDEQYLINTPERVRSGTYLAAVGGMFILAAADAANVGRWYLLNPVGSSISVALRHVYFNVGCSSTTIGFANSPRLTLDLFTFTGTASGTTVTPAKQKSTIAAPTATLRTTNGGLTITQGALIKAMLPIIGFTGGVGAGVDHYGEYLRDRPTAYNPNATDPATVVLAAGEGVMFRQADVGATSEATSRTMVTSILWEEYTLP